MKGGFWPNAGDVYVRAFDTAPSKVGTEAEFYSKWHFISFYRLGDEVGFCYDGTSKVVDPTQERATPGVSYSVYFGGANGVNPYTGILASM